MDCVGCDKCRLWGKVQTTGLGVALKILFELDEKTLECVLSVCRTDYLSNAEAVFTSPTSNWNLLQRSEVVALINTLHRFSESLEMVDDFRALWRESSATESARLLQDVADATHTRVRLFPLPQISELSHAHTCGLRQARSPASSEGTRSGQHGWRYLEHMPPPVKDIFDACEKGARSCAAVLLAMYSKARRVLRSLYQPNKGQGLYVDL
jgi:hypothetical protein